MTYITCERLIFLTPSIEKTVASNAIQQLCFSRISRTRSYLKCCYISLNNFLIELLEITDPQKAHQLAFFNPVHNHSITHCAAIGLRTDHLEKTLEHLANHNIHATELYASKDPKYSKGYKHRTACLDMQWFGRMVYLSEYDKDFFEIRKNDIVTDVEKMHRFSVQQTPLNLKSFCPPDFISFNNKIPKLKVYTTNKNFNTLECDWMVLSTAAAL
jgi:hypothetical protein